MYFPYFIIISPWKRAWPFIWTNLNPHHPRMPCLSLVEIGPVVLEKKIFKFSQCTFAISLLSPIRKGRGTSFEQIWITFTQGCFVSRFVEIGPVVLKKKMFKVCICILAISLLSPLEKEHDPSFEQIWIPITQGCFLPSLVEIGPVVLEKMKMWKFYRRTDRQTDRRRTTGDQESSLELSAHVRLKRFFFLYSETSMLSLWCLVPTMSKESKNLGRDLARGLQLHDVPFIRSR